MLTEVGRVGARLHHMTGDLHPHGQNSPDIPMSLYTKLFHTPILLPKGHRMAGSETTDDALLFRKLPEFESPLRLCLPTAARLWLNIVSSQDAKL